MTGLPTHRNLDLRWYPCITYIVQICGSIWRWQHLSRSKELHAGTKSVIPDNWLIIGKNTNKQIAIVPAGALIQASAIFCLPLEGSEALKKEKKIYMVLMRTSRWKQQSAYVLCQSYLCVFRSHRTPKRYSSLCIQNFYISISRLKLNHMRRVKSSPFQVKHKLRHFSPKTELHRLWIWS